MQQRYVGLCVWVQVNLSPNSALTKDFIHVRLRSDLMACKIVNGLTLSNLSDMSYPVLSTLWIHGSWQSPEVKNVSAGCRAFNYRTCFSLDNNPADQIRQFDSVETFQSKITSFHLHFQLVLIFQYLWLCTCHHHASFSVSINLCSQHMRE